MKELKKYKDSINSSKSSRLLEVLQYIIIHQEITVNDLALELGLNKRTIQRHLNLLECYDFIEYIRGYSSIEGYAICNLKQKR